MLYLGSQIIICLNNQEIEEIISTSTTPLTPYNKDLPNIFDNTLIGRVKYRYSAHCCLYPLLPCTWLSSFLTNTKTKKSIFIINIDYQKSKTPKLHKEIAKINTNLCFYFF